jgi:hypothetical protein
MDINSLLPFFEKYGFKGVLGLIAIYFLYSIIKLSWFDTFIKEIIEKFKNRKNNSVVNNDITESDILNHDIFNYIDFWLYSKIPTIQFSTEYRTEIFRKYLTIYLKKHKENIHKYITSKNFQDMDDNEIWKSILDLINRIIYDYEKEMVEIGIPEIVIQKMKVKNNDTVTLTIDLIEGICTSNFYKSNKNLLKVYSILNILLSILQNTIFSSESTCNSINGALQGLSFNGKVEPYHD